MKSANLIAYPIDEAICNRAASLRAGHAWQRTPDALQVATAIEHGADIILTNDDRWKALTEIVVMVLRDQLQDR